MDNTRHRILMVGPCGTQQIADLGILRRTGADVWHVPCLAEFPMPEMEANYDLVVIDIPDDLGEALRQCELIRSMPQGRDAVVVLVTNYDYGSDSWWMMEPALRPDVCVHSSTVASVLGGTAA